MRSSTRVAPSIIPTANCYFYHNDFRSAADKIEEAVEICRKYPDMIPYIDKQAEPLFIKNI